MCNLILIGKYNTGFVSLRILHNLQIRSGKNQVTCNLLCITIKV